MIDRLAPSIGMREERYAYIRAWCRYLGMEGRDVAALLARAERESPPSTVYAITVEGRWLDSRDLEPLAREGGVVAIYTLTKLREYAGADR